MKNKYVDQFLNSNCCASILPLFSNYRDTNKRNKEISESMACLEAFRLLNKDPNSSINFNSSDTAIFVIGDGIRPRTGMIFAYYTKCQVISIDPLMDMRWWERFLTFKSSERQKPERIHLKKNVVENIDLKDFDCEKMIIVLPHSHASMSCCVSKIREYQSLKKGIPVRFINLPCCKEIPRDFLQKDFVLSSKMIHYIDENILSPRNSVYIWDFSADSVLSL